MGTVADARSCTRSFVFFQNSHRRNVRRQNVSNQVNSELTCVEAPRYAEATDTLKTCRRGESWSFVA